MAWPWWARSSRRSLSRSSVPGLAGCLAVGQSRSGRLERSARQVAARWIGNYVGDQNDLAVPVRVSAGVVVSGRANNGAHHIGTLMPRLMSQTLAGQLVRTPATIPICIRNQ